MSQAYTPKKYGFTQVDVFAHTALGGNPLAVVHSAHDLTTEQMQAFARWTNLSETTFLLPPTSPEADYKVRIFTPSQEFIFAGHPTLGSAFSWLHAGGTPRNEGVVVQECGIGNVSVKISGNTLAFAAPPLQRSGTVAADLLADIATALRITPDDIVASNWIDNGPGWTGVLLRSGAEVLNFSPDFAAMGDLKLAVAGAYPANSAEKASGIDYEVRALIPDAGLGEDPVTGSANAGLAQWLIAAGHAPREYVARQGTVIGYNGRVFISADDDNIWVGGTVIPTITGTVHI
ncbi:PhzF family phenazine biosynthesis protein [Timonella sp. A28]|uniref:PhzF family phenazine biosynthesis protein n=1 Tax=Timonella sp. A28 TaxID=3442640 RepID=UPI003EBD9C36